MASRSVGGESVANQRVGAGQKPAYTFASSVEPSNRIRYVLQVTREMGMATSSSQRWEWIVAVLLALCVIGYIWTLQ
jgi:hypothetical protein